MTRLLPGDTATESDRPRGTRRVLRYPDLAATVYPYFVPPGLADELPDLYGTVFTTLDWFLTWDGRLPTGACVLDDPRHVVLFYRDGATIEVLNKVFEMAPADAARLCRALFRALPLALRVHLDVMFPPYELGLPRRRLLNHDYLMLDMPESAEAYDASLSKSTRRKIRQGTKRLHRDFSELSTDVVVPGQDASPLVRQLAAWKIENFGRHGRTTYWETENGRVERTAGLVARCGEARVTSIAGRAVALALVCRAGGGVLVLEVGFDPAYRYYDLGFLAFYWALRDAVASGARSVNLHIGTPDFKERLGARRVPVTTVSVFRSPLVRPLYAAEGARLLWDRRGVYLWGVRFLARWLARRVWRTPRSSTNDRTSPTD